MCSIKVNLNNTTQIDRYKKLIQFIDKNFKEEINIEKIEAISHYSYRNINRIFQALHNETIGKYIKRIRLEKAAEYLKYSEEQVSDIAINIGFSDVASFGKAFRKKFNCSPISFRKSTKNIQTKSQQVLKRLQQKPLLHTIEILPEFDVLYLEHKGSHQNLKAIEKTWDRFIQYCDNKQLIFDESIFFSEIIDDNEITDDLQCRTNVAIILKKPLSFVPKGLFQVKPHASQKYVKFVHKGTNEQLLDTYNHIYSSWMIDIQLEFEDKPTLEFYVNHHEEIPKSDLITEIYIPVK
ncbi:AraC family transcriptional regulator [Tenacibaculum sp. M341]|nr:AraC family transcriptional regulator [Tenacibaculum sp. M341]